VRFCTCCFLPGIYAQRRISDTVNTCASHFFTRLANSCSGCYKHTSWQNRYALFHRFVCVLRRHSCSADVLFTHTDGENDADSRQVICGRAGGIGVFGVVIKAYVNLQKWGLAGVHEFKWALFGDTMKDSCINVKSCLFAQFRNVCADSTGWFCKSRWLNHKKAYKSGGWSPHMRDKHKLEYYMTPNGGLCPHVLQCKNAYGPHTSVDFVWQKHFQNRCIEGRQQKRFEKQELAVRHLDAAKSKTGVKKSPETAFLLHKSTWANVWTLQPRSRQGPGRLGVCVSWGNGRGTWDTARSVWEEAVWKCICNGARACDMWHGGEPRVWSAIVFVGGRACPG